MRNSNYPVGDFIVRLKNTALSGKKSLSLPKTKLISAVSYALKKEGFIDEIKESKDLIEITLSMKSKKPLISDVEIVSRPGRRVYMGVDELENEKGPYIFILSTPSGVISSKEAIKKRLGGEVIAKIW